MSPPNPGAVRHKHVRLGDAGCSQVGSDHVRSVQSLGQDWCLSRRHETGPGNPGCMPALPGLGVVGLGSSGIRPTPAGLGVREAGSACVGFGLLRGLWVVRRYGARMLRY